MSCGFPEKIADVYVSVWARPDRKFRITPGTPVTAQPGSVSLIHHKRPQALKLVLSQLQVLPDQVWHLERLRDHSACRSRGGESG